MSLLPDVLVWSKSRLTEVTKARPDASGNGRFRPRIIPAAGLPSLVPVSNVPTIGAPPLEAPSAAAFAQAAGQGKMDC
ncbi:MAG: hypothetical protein R3316_12605 [Rhodovibrionaceae bacterium]|nr:hypothetical protein [Rhodovibrionaceae bacterium]